MKAKLVLLLVVVLTAACGGDVVSGEAPAEWEDLLQETVLEEQPGCSTCHSLEPGQVIVGPSLAGVGARAGDRVEGLTAEEYIEQSIRNPDAYVVEGFEEGTMPSWDEILSDAQIEALVAYLLTLDG